MCALTIKKAIPFSSKKNDRIYLKRALAWRWNRWAVVNARSSRVESVVMTVIICAGWWNYMSRNLSSSITARTDMSVTRYERG